ncbi:MAG: class I SAM-dependent methyltransferase [Bacteroidales bacterium]
MDTLTIEQLSQIPWNRKFVSGPDVPPEPDIDEIAKLVDVPFMKRRNDYGLFYSWVEVIKMTGNRGMTILDSSCGRGQIAQILNLKGNKVKACDIEDYFCADRKVIDFTKADLNSTFPYEDKSFDLIINCEGLEYLNDSDYFLRECKRVLKKDGRLILSVPNIQSIVSQISFFRKGTLMSYESCLPSRKNLIYLPLLKAQLNRNNFTIKEISGNIPLGGRMIRYFSSFARLFSAYKRNPFIPFAHSLIIEAILYN